MQKSRKKRAGNAVQSSEELAGVEEESRRQALPEQKAVFSVSEKTRRLVHKPSWSYAPPLDYDEQKGFERAYPYLRLPVPHTPNHGDTAIFNERNYPRTGSSSATISSSSAH